MVRQKQFHVSRFVRSESDKAQQFALFFTRLAVAGTRYSVAEAGFGPRFALESPRTGTDRAELQAEADRLNAGDSQAGAA